MRFTHLLADDAILAELGANLERARLERNLTQAQVADQAPVTLLQADQSRVPVASSTKMERVNAARRVWESGKTVLRTLSERHCRLRSIARDLPGADVLRHSGHAPVSAYAAESRYHRPALLVAISNAAGDFTGVEVTYLAQNAQRASDLRLSRKTVGVMPTGSAVRIDAVAPQMLVAEGVFTTLSSSERFSLPAWSLMSTRNLRSWSPPPTEIGRASCRERV